MATSAARFPFRHLFYGTCRRTGRIRTRAYFAKSDTAAALARCADRAADDLIGARYVATTRSHGRRADA